MISLYEYRLPFLTPLKTGAGEFSFRKGIIIHFNDEDVDILAEASPLPGFSRESFQSVKTQLLSIKTELDSFFKGSFSLPELQQFISGPASVQFAVSDLGLKIIKHRGFQPLDHPLFRSEKRSVIVNDILGYHDPETTKRLILSALDSGFKTIKIKTPVPDPHLATVLREVYSYREDVIYRLDANQSWDTEKLKTFNRHFKDIPIEYIEEPFPMHNDEEIESVTSICECPIAMDESITDLDHLHKLLKKYPDLFIIIKPMIFGNIFKLTETLSNYRSNYKRVVITSSLESAVGLETISKIAASLGDNSRAHGLNTGKLFRNDLIINDDMRCGGLKLSNPLDSTIKPGQLDQSMLTLI